MDYNEIIPGMFVGNMQIDIEILKALNIMQILSVGFDYAITDIIPCKFISVCDDPSENIYQYFDDTFDCIDNILQRNESIYIHCIAGVSRSTTIATAFLMKKNGWSISDALAQVQSKRSMADPNSGFIEQLKLYQSNFLIPIVRDRLQGWY